MRDDRIWDALTAINRRYGRGKVVEVDLTNREVTRCLNEKEMTHDVVGYTVSGDPLTHVEHVYFLGQTRCIDKGSLGFLGCTCPEAGIQD